MPRYKSRVGRKRRGGSAPSGGSIPTGPAASMTGGSVRVGGILPPWTHLSNHLHAAHTVLRTPRKTWRFIQHMAALHAGDSGTPLYPGVTAHKVAALGLDYAKAPKAAYKDIVRGSREMVSQGLLEEMKDHYNGHYKGAGLHKALSNAMKTVHGLGKQAMKHGKTFVKHAPKHWRRFKNTLDKTDSYVEHAGNVMEAAHEGFSEAAQQYADAGLAGSEYLKEELMPGAQGWYDSAKGIQEATRGVTEAARGQAQGMEDAVGTVVDPIRAAVRGEEEDLFA